MNLVLKIFSDNRNGVCMLPVEKHTKRLRRLLLLIDRLMITNSVITVPTSKLFVVFFLINNAVLLYKLCNRLFVYKSDFLLIFSYLFSFYIFNVNVA